MVDLAKLKRLMERAGDTRAPAIERAFSIERMENALVVAAPALIAELEAARECVKHLRNVLDRNEAEARLQAAAQTATENYIDDTPDMRAWEHAMLISSEAESDARKFLAAYDAATKAESGGGNAD